VFTIFVLLLLSAVDIKSRRIPKATTLSLLAILSLTNGNRIPDALFVFLGFGLLRWRSRFAVGYGDVRVSPVAALITDSLKSCVELLLVSWCLAGIWLLIRRQNGDETLPFAPFLTLSAIFQAS